MYFPKPSAHTTDDPADCPQGHVNRMFQQPPPTKTKIHTPGSSAFIAAIPKARACTVP